MQLGERIGSDGTLELRSLRPRHPGRQVLNVLAYCCLFVSDAGSISSHFLYVFLPVKFPIP